MSTRRIDWKNIDSILIKNYENGESSRSLSQSLDIGFSTIKKRLKILGAVSPEKSSEIIYCLNCETELTTKTQKKFCNRSCAAIYNNVINPSEKMLASKKQPESTCDNCGKPNTKSRKYCQECWVIVNKGKSLEKWESTQLKDMKRTKETNSRNRYPYIAGLARKTYEQSKLPKECFICGYDFHVDIAHIQAISDFPETAFISEVNNIKNLVALCKNHHWEYDRGFLKL